jgi:hypothetical protein
MRTWGPAESSRLRELLQSGEGVAAALRKLGASDLLLASAWRIFSADFPAGGGVDAWNTRPWREVWLGLPELHVFGEDLFGNLLATLPGKEATYLIDHECGELHDLQLDPMTLIEVCATEGAGWLDFYSGDALRIAASEGIELSPESHLHWVTPLILGGTPERSNVVALPREQHMLGHAELWRQIRDLPPGARVIVR